MALPKRRVRERLYSSLSIWDTSRIENATLAREAGSVPTTLSSLIRVSLRSVLVPLIRRIFARAVDPPDSSRRLCEGSRATPYTQRQSIQPACPPQLSYESPIAIHLPNALVQLRAHSQEADCPSHS